jgi:hypothetical protein
VTVDADGLPRRLDIGDRLTRAGVEYKTGYQTATIDNLSEVSRDAILIEQGWSITWVFQGTASAQLLKALADAKIPYEFR